jgi:biopolymer transport protein ExbD
MEGMNMTPMIDIVFQLLIFFMLIMDMSRAQIEALTLPAASKAIKEKFDDPKLLLINVMKDGTVKIGGKVFWRPKDADAKKLDDVFNDRRRKRQYQEVAGKDDWVNYPVMIRADRSTNFEHVQMLLMIAAKEGGVTKIQLGAKQSEGTK